jgi:ketosteroid isomerase-like protein
MRDPVEVVRLWKERNRAGDLDSLGEVVDLEGYTETCLGLTGWTKGYDVARRNYVHNLIEPWKDMVTTEEEVVAGPDSHRGQPMAFDGYSVDVDDTVVVRSRTEATQVGEFLGVAPTGKRIVWNSVALVWVKDGRVVGQWAQPDLWSMYRQITGAE